MNILGRFYYYVTVFYFKIIVNANAKLFVHLPGNRLCRLKRNIPAVFSKLYAFRGSIENM